MKSRSALGTLLVVLLICWLPIIASSETITVKSGNAAVGQQDASVYTYKWGDEANKQQAWAVNPVYGWGQPAEGTLWVSPSANRYSDSHSPWTYRWYETSFTLPEGYSCPSMSVSWMSDSYGFYVLLNDNPIVGLTAGFGAPIALSTVDETFFHAGVNTLKFMTADDGNATGINFLASINYGAGPLPPQIVSLAPNSGSIIPGNKSVFSCTYSDPNGHSDLSNCSLLMNTAAGVSANSVYLLYNPVQNKLYLRNDAGNAYTGGYAPGSANVLENSQCKVYCAETTVQAVSSQLTVNWKIELKSALSGKTLLQWMYAADKEGQTDGWDKKGAIGVGQPPVDAGLSPITGTIVSGIKQQFTCQYTDADGSGDIACAFLLLNKTTGQSANTVYAVYNQKVNLLYLRNDAGTGWIGGFAPGSANNIENSQCRISCAGTTVTGSGNNLTVNWAIYPKSAMAGSSWMEWMMVTDREGFADGWDKMGTISAQ